MATFIVFVVLSLVISTVHFVAAVEPKVGFEDSLKHWETFSMSSIRNRIVKRDITSKHPVEQLINFQSYGRHFSLKLRKDFSVLAPGLKILVFEANGSSSEVHLDLNLYRGTVEGEGTSSISAYWNGDNALSASIQTASGLYFVEPAVNLNPNATNDTMIIYRESDLRWDNNSRCGYISPPNDDNKLKKPIKDQILNETKSSRSKRGTCSGTNKNTCYLYLVAHPKFFREIGKSDITETATRMLLAIDNVDQIFRSHQFEGCDSGYGFEVQKMHIFKTETQGYPYTSDKNFVYDEFLKVFSNDKTLNDVCIGHIFTYQVFYDAGYVLGLAYVGNPEYGNSGGICDFGSNSGWTTYIGSYPTPTLQSQLVTAHGHSWGSPHDSPSTPGCTHPASEGGNYIVYPSAVSGRDRNNFLFSPCSKVSIGRVLNVKATCLGVSKMAFCGNYRIDEGEECDAGFIAITDGSLCCDSTCKLRAQAQCSENDLCCTKDCKIMPKETNTLCYKSNVDVCLEDSMCNGHDRSCPPSKNKPDNTICFNQGKCRSGECKGLCVLNNMEPCSCDTAKDDACKLCCIGQKSSCFPLLDEDRIIRFLPKGMACAGGICDDKGTCLAISKSLMMRLWDLLDLSSPGGFVKLMRNNIVWTIVILSLFVWVPISCLVSYLDRKAKKEREMLIHEVVQDLAEDTDSLSIIPSETSVQPEGGVAQKSKTEPDARPVSATPSQTSVRPMDRLAQRRATVKDEIREVVRGLSLQKEDSTASDKSTAPFKSSMKRKVADGAN